MSWKDKSFEEFEKADYLKAGSQKSYYGGGMYAYSKRIKEFLHEELKHQMTMLESDKKDKLSNVDISFRNGIISQTKTLLHLISTDDLQETL